MSIIIRTFHEVWSNELASELADHLTCIEADALADLFTATGRPDLAAAWIAEHATGDDDGDAHTATS